MQKAIIILLGLLALGSAQTVVTPEGAESTPSPGSTPVVTEPTAAPTGSTPEGSGTTPVPSGSTPDGSGTAAPGGSTPDGSGSTPVVTEPTAAPTGSTPEGSGTTPVPSGSTPDGTTQAPLQTTTNPGDCVYERQTWAVPNLQQFGFCLDGVPRITECNENQYYVSNATVSGCVPANEMNVNCRNLDVVVNQCTGVYTKQPQMSEVITDYYFCDGESLEPVELSCLSGAFIKQDKYMGCFDWEEWRQLRNCEVDQLTTLKM